MTPAALEQALSRATISPYKEMLAWERLYALQGSTTKTVAEKTSLVNRRASDAFGDVSNMLTENELVNITALVNEKIDSDTFEVVVRGTPAYPDSLNDSKKPQPLLYANGDIGLLTVPNVSIVGSRDATDEGKSRAARAAKELIEHGIVVTTGLARGIDTAAAKSALTSRNKHGVAGAVIGVIGTPIDQHYPPENRLLHEQVKRQGLLVSQVPFYRYSKQDFNSKRYYFPERNELMAALSQATIIIEAGDGSGTLTQARACLQQKRPLFLAKSLLDNSTITWAKKYLEKDGVWVLEDIEQVLNVVKANNQ